MKKMMLVALVMISCDAISKPPHAPRSLWFMACTGVLALAAKIIQYNLITPQQRVAADVVRFNIKAPSRH